ncbi:F0F1 ATP synthase subunit delta [[Mycoplasma] gypis]|uniref:ATP synthase subunit delta n=1 Tax=[Mycoplasma] gypis TaxID=92404 RepID=A0ABZ2RND4_9BACT|nr:F0F1 ATP synthase subunit delta [[Mycoplasma] gypis]MBN0919373.1 F0F1 ATP synthase subunit delta [[Mycoplasma] gypis]
MNNSEIIHNYALAIFELAKENNKLDVCFVDFKLIEESIIDNPQYLKILNAYSIEDSQKFQVIDETFNGADSLILNFLKVMTKNKVIKKLKKIFEQFESFYYAFKNIKHGYIYSTKPLTNFEINDFEQVFSKKYNMELVLTNKIDPKLIGGLRIVIDDQVIDNSISSQLNKMKELILK